MSAEVNVVLKYNRNQPSWSCPMCETENSVSVGRCVLCGCMRDTRARILKTGAIQDDMGPATAPRYYAPTPAPTPTPSGMGSTPTPASYGSAGSGGMSGGAVAGLIIAGIILAAIIIMVLQNA